MIRLEAKRISWRDQVGRHAEDARRGGAVDVLVFFEGLDERRVPGEVRQDPQLDLGVVRDDEPEARRRDEGLPDLAPGGRADRDVLEVGIRGREPARRRDVLAERGMDATFLVGRAEAGHPRTCP